METPSSPRPYRLQRIFIALRTLDWKYMVIEFAIVVAGILTAFAWDSYWDNRNNKNLTHEYLVQINTELDTSITDLDHKITSMNHTLHAAAQLCRASFSDPPPSEKELRQWMLRNLYYQTPVITIATLRSMVANGDINLLTDRTLKTHITTISDQVSAYDNWRRTQITEWILPAWHDIQPFALFSALQLELLHPDSVTAIALRDTSYFLPASPRQQAFPINLTVHLKDPDFHNVMLDTYVARRDLLSRTIAIRAAVVSLREEINAWIIENSR